MEQQQIIKLIEEKQQQITKLNSEILKLADLVIAAEMKDFEIISTTEQERKAERHYCTGE